MKEMNAKRQLSALSTARVLNRRMKVLLHRMFVRWRVAVERDKLGPKVHEIMSLRSQNERMEVEVN